MPENYKKLVHNQIFDRNTFIRAVFSGFPKDASPNWIRVLVRPVEIKGEHKLQISYFDEQKDISKNFSDTAAINKINKILESSFRNIHIETTESNIQIQKTKKGKIIIGESKSSLHADNVNFAHDHKKKKLLTTSDALPFLQVVGIANADGRIKANMQKKYSQINEFLRLIDETSAFAEFDRKSIRVVDFGCGKAYLTFALFFYLTNILKMNATVIGVDIKNDIFDRNKENAAKLEWENLQFQVGTIADFRSEIDPDVVVALHACDTATDDALAQGIRWGSKIIITAPCCQHELQVQLSHKSYPHQLSLISHYGILKERLGDILTDTFRAGILQIFGYRTDVTQFVSPEHTAKNLMIRSVKTNSAGNNSRVTEYKAMKDFWKITPYLERQLGDEYAKWFTRVEYE